MPQGIRDPRGHSYPNAPARSEVLRCPNCGYTMDRRDLPNGAVLWSCVRMTCMINKVGREDALAIEHRQ